MTYIEDYEYSYSIFLAEQELFNNMVNISSNNLNMNILESIIIVESIKETIQKYLTKIKEAIQKVWNVFKDKVGGAIDKKYLGYIKERVKTYNPNCKLTNFPTIKNEGFDNLKLKDFNYDEMKESLDTKENFINKFYSFLPSNTDPNTIDARVQKHCTELTEVFCDNAKLQDIYKYCNYQYTADIRVIEEDLKKVNQSQENINSFANKINEDNVYGIIGYYQNLIYINEADDPSKVSGSPAGSMAKSDNKSNNSTTTPSSNDSKNTTTDKAKVGYEKADEEQKSPEQEKEEKEKHDRLIKEIQVYMSGSCEILSAKMKIVRNQYKKYMDILHHFLPYNENKEIKNEEITDDNGNTSSQYKVKI